MIHWPDEAPWSPSKLLKRILITGASGFIGKYLARAFHRRGYSVIAQVRPSSNIEGLTDLPRLRIVYGALENPSWLSSIDEKIDTVLHLALPNRLNPQTDEGFLRELFGQCPFHLVYFSSICAAGLDFCPQPISETLTETCPPRFLPYDFYGIYKWEVEELVKRCAEKHNFSATLLRPAVVYGPRMHGKSPLPLFRAIRNRNLVLWRGGQNRISFCAIENLVKTTLSIVSHPPPGRRLYHVADPEQMSLREFCGLAADAMGEPLTYREGSTTFVKQVASCVRVTNRIGWTRSFADQYGWSRNTIADTTRLLNDYPDLTFTPTRAALTETVKDCLKTGLLEYQ